MEKRIYTAESVTQGHPDKLADLIADSILDECLMQDRESRVACEMMLTKGKVLVAGEITTKAKIDYLSLARKVIEDTGYDTMDVDFECRIHTQSDDIADGVSRAVEVRKGLANHSYDEQGAGDQGIVYGYACNETSGYMPLAVELAHQLTSRLDQCRKEGLIAGLLPDGKVQVTIEYINDRFSKVKSVIVSAQHEEDKDLIRLAHEIMEKVISYVFIETGLSEDTEILINPSGRFVEGGFNADTGLTGRKLMVDSYGGITRHGGGAFSGKDPSKVDRSGAYMARYVAKNIVAAGLAEKCEVSVSYAIGKAHPTSVDINTFYTGVINEQLIKKFAEDIFDFRPRAIIEHLGLKAPIYSATAVGGHFGRNQFSWEKLDKVKALKDAVYGAEE